MAVLVRRSGPKATTSHHTIRVAIVLVLLLETIKGRAITCTPIKSEDKWQEGGKHRNSYSLHRYLLHIFNTSINRREHKSQNVSTIANKIEPVPRDSITSCVPDGLEGNSGHRGCHGPGHQPRSDRRRRRVASQQQFRHGDRSDARSHPSFQEEIGEHLCDGSSNADIDSTSFASASRPPAVPSGGGGRPRASLRRHRALASPGWRADGRPVWPNSLPARQLRRG